MQSTEKKKRVLAFGTFDRLHLGHVHFLETAKKLGTELIVIVARDATVVKVKGRPTLHTETERVRALKKLAIADKVVLGSTSDYLARVRTYAPDVFCLGYDQVAMVPLLKKYRARALPHSRIVRARPLEPTRYKSSLLPKFAHLPLARGVVVSGRGEGRKLGYPTANVHAPASVRRLYPAGVYASEVYCEKKIYQGATVIGVRKELGGPLVETHIVGIKKNFYGKTLTIVLDKKIRNTKRYRGASALINDIKKDIEYVHRYYTQPRHRTHTR